MLRQWLHELGPVLLMDAHQFVVTARVRATETLLRAGIGRICTLDEMKPTTTITFDYPPRFVHLLKAGELAKYRKAAYQARRVIFGRRRVSSWCSPRVRRFQRCEHGCTGELHAST